MAVGDDLGPGIFALTWILTVASTVVIALRLFVRLRLRETNKLSVDDYIIIVTYGLGMVNSIFVTISAHWGLGKHQHVLAEMPKNISYTIKWVYLSEGPAIMAAGLSRISFALLLLRLTPPSVGKRRFLWAIMIIQLVFDLAAVIATYAQCQPVQRYWDPSISGSCWAPTVQQYTGFVQGSVCSLVDFILACYPASLFWNLNMKKSQKVYLSGIMGLGFVACVASTAKTINLRAFTQTQDFTYALGQVAMWWTTEVNLVLIAVSIPALSPIIKPKKSTTSGRSGSSGDVVMNTFNSRKRAHAKGLNDTDSGFERLNEHPEGH